MNENN